MSKISYASLPVAVGLWFAPVGLRYLSQMLLVGTPLMVMWRDPRGTVVAASDVEDPAKMSSGSPVDDENGDLVRRFNAAHLNAGEVCIAT